jgi:hypothetical protein
MKDKTTISLLTEYLPRFGWPGYKVVEDTPAGGKIFTGWVSPVGGVRPMFLVIDHGEETLTLVCPALAAARQDEMPVGQLADTLTALGFANFALQMGRFCYDPRDGEIRFEFGMPLAGARLTYEQFAYMLKAAQAAVTYWAPRIKDAAQGERSGADIVKSFLGHVAQFAH